MSQTTKCAMNLSKEQRAAAKAKHEAAGRKLVGTTRCVCGQHDRDMYR